MEKSRKDIIQEISFNALIAAAYVVLTVLISPLSYGAIQFRISEILVLFCFFNKRYGIGLTLGCLIANIFSPTASLDVIFGTIATALACLCIMFSKHLIIAIMFPVIFNAFIIGWELTFFNEPYWLSVLTVGLGELAVMIVGYIFFTFIRQSRGFLKAIKANQNLDSRSVIARLAVIYLKIVRHKDKNLDKRIKKILKDGEQDWVMPKSISKDIEEENYNDMKVYYVNKNSNYQNVLFYIHGGYYLHQPLKFHVKMLKRILKGGNTMLVFPLYPKAPWHTVEDSFANMVSLFKKIKEDNLDKKIILAGDSAGGGYSLALAESLNNQPDELILLSPWVDISMKNEEAKNFIKVDPMLSMDKAIYAGNAWKGKYDENDYHVSPINGDLSKLKNVTIFVGTHEFFYPDNTLLYNKIKEKDIKVTLYVGDRLNHVYPAFPTREGHKAVNQIREIINRKTLD